MRWLLVRGWSQFVLGFLVCVSAAQGAPSFVLAEPECLAFTLDHSPTPEKHMVETMAGGLAVFDYNGDGASDIFFANGAALPELDKTEARYWNRLFANDGKGCFDDVTEEAGVRGEGYSMGAAVADYDNDGDVDLFVAGVFANLLYENLGDGRFRDVTGESGIGSEDWAVAAGWFDYDSDGLLDLLVANYAEWTPEYDRFCGDRAKGVRVYCHPKYFPPVPNRLYRNLGEGRFEDVSKSSGIAAHKGRGMSVAFADYDGDGDPDAFVTNDNLPNFLFRNKGDGTFDEDALFAGVALLDHGRPVASMGTDFRDYDNDGQADVFVTALSGETFPVFRNVGDGAFQDATFRTGVAKASAPYSGWCVGLADFDNDGLKDLFAANAHVNDIVEQFEDYEYRQPNTVFPGVGGGKFGPAVALERNAPHRGCGFADFDGDGRIDVVVSSLGEPAELWRNTSSADNHWLRVALVGKMGSRDGFGARIRLGEQWNEVTSAVGYASSSHSGTHFGLASTETIEEVEIIWPNGTRQILKEVAADQVVTVEELHPAQ